MTAFRCPVRATCLFLLATLAPVASMDALAQVPAQKISPPPTQRPLEDPSLALGEQYAITSKRGQVNERYSGSLVAANSDWLVLRSVSEWRNESSTPVVGVIPYVQRYFRNVSIGRVSEFIWVPRSAVSKCERLTTAAPSESAALIQAAHHEAPQAAAPQFGVDCSLDLVDGKETTSRQGKLAKLAGGKLALTCEHIEVVERPLEGAKRVPFFGGFFTTQENVIKKTVETHSLDKILSIHVPFAFPENSQ